MKTSGLICHIGHLPAGDNLHLATEHREQPPRGTSSGVLASGNWVLPQTRYPLVLSTPQPRRPLLQPDLPHNHTLFMTRFGV